MQAIKSLPLDRVTLRPSVFAQRAALNRNYLMSLHSQALLQNHLMEAGLWARALSGEAAEFHTEHYARHPIHWGWESPSSQVRGHFLGHWLSAAARLSAGTGDIELKAKADAIVSELARCQEANGGEWVASIPEKYLHWVSRGKPVWAPHYVAQKTLMGLLEMAEFAGSEQALQIARNYARWFIRWTAQFSREQMDDLLDFETGAMMESCANLYALTGDEEHLELMRRYERPRLFEPLLAGEDVLTNRHANTTIPEAHGAARAFELTGERRYRDIAEAYWRLAVSERGCFCTGGQTTGEVWNPPQAFAARLGDKTQEHCTVYNMMRLAEYLFRWSGDAAYTDYCERNLYNGILAQQHPDTGMISYFLPMHPGARKTWGSPTQHFWCCHGSLVQAHAAHQASVYYEDVDGLVLAQFIPTELRWRREGVPVKLTQGFDPQNGASANTSSVQSQKTNLAPAHPWSRPNSWAIDLTVECEAPVAFALKIRLPEWLAGAAEIRVNGVPEKLESTGGFHTLRRTWHSDRVRLLFPKGLHTAPVPDDPERVAFLDGPVVLAGLCDEERRLCGCKEHPETLLAPDNEREWGTWKGGYRAAGQERGLRFVPLHEVRDEAYTLYFPVKEP